MSSSSLTHLSSLFLIASLLLLSSVVTSYISPEKAPIPSAKAPTRARRQNRQNMVRPALVTTARARIRAKRNRDTREFLQAHNLARVASGASDLKWDRGLARYATKWAKQLKPYCKMTHSNGSFGENIFWYRRGENWSPKRVVAKWVEENLNYDRSTNTCASGKMCGHYTQIIWRTTTAVGCGLTRCDNGLGFLVVCEYSPQGNYEGESPFDLPKTN